MCPVQRQGSGPARGAGHDNDVQVPYSLVAWPCLRRAVQPSQTTLDMRPLRQILSGEATLIGLLDRRRRELMLLDQVQQTGVADASPPELVLSAASGAAATLLRHRGPELLQRLSREGWKFTGIRVRVQVRANRTDRSKIHAKQIDERSAAKLRAIADRLSDPRLAAALRRLAKQGSVPSDDQQPFKGIEDQHPEEQK